MKNGIKTGKSSWTLGLIISALCCIFYASLISFRTMPIAEGWYTEYAWLINHGSLPYRDFEYLFFPLYIYTIAGFTKIFGYSIVALRIFGVLIFGAIGAGLFCIYSKFFENFPATIAAVASALFMQSEVVQIFYDYIRLHDLFAIITTFFLVELTIKCSKPEIVAHSRISSIFQILTFFLVFLTSAFGLYLGIGTAHRIRLIIFSLSLFTLLICLCLVVYSVKKGKGACIHSIPIESFLCGIFVSAECMVKQSTGMLMIFFTLVYFIFCALTLRNIKYFRVFLGALIGVAFSFSLMLLFLQLTESFDAFVTCCFLSAMEAKGGIANELFRWIPTAWSSFWNIRIQAFGLAILIQVLYELSRRKTPYLMKNGNRLVIINGILVLLICVFFVKNSEWAKMADANYNDNLSAFVFFSCSIAFWAYAIYLLVCFASKVPVPNVANHSLMLLFPALGVVFTQGYGVGMSGGLVSSQIAIGFGLVLGCCLDAALKTKATSVAIALYVFSTFSMATFIGQKSVETYNWWGLTQGAVWENAETVDVPLLENIKVRPADKQCYETVYKDVIDNTEESDSIFAFPHCPIFYTITNRHSGTYTKVQWFDVSSVDAIEMDIAELRDNPPKMIIYATVPDFTYESHESGFHTYQTRMMRDFLMNELIPIYGYEILNTVDLGNGYMVSTYLMP